MADLAGAPRPLGPVLLVAILVMPGAFAWLLLRRGYSPTLRIGAFLYAALVVGITQVYRLRP